MGAKMPDGKHKNGHCTMALSHRQLRKGGNEFPECTVTGSAPLPSLVKISWSAV